MPFPKLWVQFLKAENSKWPQKCIQIEFPSIYHIVMYNLWFLGGVGSKNPFQEFLRYFDLYIDRKIKMTDVVLINKK